MTFQPARARATTEVLYGDHIRRALDNTPKARGIMDFPHVVAAYAHVKKACAAANAELGTVPAGIAKAISLAADEVIAGQLDDQFPTPLIVGGGGTSTNMNFNEVLATRASQLLDDGTSVHPTDHVNRSQSSNDTFPTAMALTVILGSRRVIDAVQVLVKSLEEKAAEYEGARHLGRTCLNDAVEMPISATHLAQAHALERVLRDFEASVEALCAVPLGGTAVGTAVGAPEGFGPVALGHLARNTGVDVVAAGDIFDAMSNSDPYSRVASELRRLSQLLYKLCADLRFLSSGPKGGINEIVLPSLQKGSSIMPGKVNPTIPEVVMAQMLLVRGRAHAVDEAVDAGELQINVMAGVMLESILDMFESIADCAPLLAEKCVDGLRWNTDVLERKLQVAFDKSVNRALEVGYEQSSQERADVPVATG